MSNTINPYLSSYLTAYSASYGYNGYNGYSSNVSDAPFDITNLQQSAKQTASEMQAAYTKNKATVKTLKEETAQYLDQYTAGMKTLSQTANALRGDNLDKLLYNKEGQVTDETIDATVKAMQDMVNSYNSNLTVLNDNADRGSGTLKQLGRMAMDPAPEESMKMVGVTVNSDGTLVLDADAMKEALRTSDPNQLKLHKDIIGGYGGIADGANKDAQYGLNASARSLIDSDLANIQATKQENPFTVMYNSLGKNVFAMNNQAAAGMFFSMLA